MKTIFRINLSPFLALFTLLLAVLGVEAWFFDPMFWSPNQYMIVQNPDGLQIYFNYAYHIKFGSGTTLTSQAYPFYDYIFMTDAQGMLSICMSVLQDMGLPINTYSIGIFNLFLLMGIPLSAFFLFKIFRHFNIHSWYSALASFFICILSPQWLRIICGHFGLGYVFYFPALIYLLLKITNTAGIIWKYVFAYIFLLIFFGLNNAHMSLASVMLTLSFALIYYFTTSPKSYRLLIIGTIAFIFFYSILKLADPVSDREKFPYGFTVFYAQFESIFLPRSGKLYDFINSFIKVEPCSVEGEAYIGVFGFVIAAWSIFRAIRFLIRGKIKRILQPLVNRQVNALLICSIPILFYAMAFPFRFGAENLLEYFPTLSQFRAPGRFAWIFFYCFLIYAFYFFYLSVRKYKKHALIFVPIFILFVMPTYVDMKSFHDKNRYWINMLGYSSNIFSNVKSTDSILRHFQIDTLHYQSVACIPSINSWSSKYGRDLDANRVAFPMVKASYASGLPWMNAKLSRISTKTLLLSNQLYSHPVIEKEILNFLPNKKNVLIIADSTYYLTTEEQTLLNNCTYLFHDSIYKYYQLNPNTSFNELRDSLRSSFDREFRNQQLVDSFYYYKYFRVNEKAVANKQVDKLIFEHVFEADYIDTAYEFSLWTKVDHEKKDMAEVQTIFTNKEGKELRIEKLKFARSHDYQHGYMRTELKFIGHPDIILRVMLLKGDEHEVYRLMLRPLNRDVWDTTMGGRSWNNFMLD